MITLDRYCEQIGASSFQTRVLTHLLGECNDDGVIEPFSLTDCAAEFSDLGGASGRRTLANALRHLEALGVLKFRPRHGVNTGRVVITPTRFDGVGEARASARGRARARAPRAPGDLGFSDERAPLGLGREVENSSYLPRDHSNRAARDWVDDELEELLVHLLDLCRRCSLPGLSNRPGALRALAPYSRRQVINAAAVVVQRVKAGDKIRSPIGVLVRAAKLGLEEYFPELPPIVEVAGVVEPPESPAPAPAHAAPPPDGWFSKIRRTVVQGKAAS